MSDENPEHLLASYTLGGLSDEEKERLFAAALTDQELFDRLAEEEKARLGFQRPENRAHILSALRETAPPWTEEIAAWFRRPKFLVFSGAAAALAIAILVLVLPSNNGLTVTLDPARGPSISMLSVETPGTQQTLPADWSQLFRLRLKQHVAARLGINKSGGTPVYRIGEELRIGLSVQNGGNCLLLDRQEGQLPAQLFPNRFNSTMSVPAGQTVFIPPAGQGNLSVAGPAGLHQVRLIVVPGDVTLDLTAPAAWADQATIIEREYRVVPATDR
ncbi:MAG: DUF4384 domain-containing protein [Bryobacteraceae bacterium]|jgi:hypothetical protein